MMCLARLQLPICADPLDQSVGHLQVVIAQHLDLFLVEGDGRQHLHDQQQDSDPVDLDAELLVGWRLHVDGEIELLAALGHVVVQLRREPVVVTELSRRLQRLLGCRPRLR